MLVILLLRIGLIIAIWCLGHVVAGETLVSGHAVVLSFSAVLSLTIVTRIVIPRIAQATHATLRPHALGAHAPVWSACRHHHHAVGVEVMHALLRVQGVLGIARGARQGLLHWVPAAGGLVLLLLELVVEGV